MASGVEFCNEYQYQRRQFCQVSGGCVPIRSWALFQAASVVPQLLAEKTLKKGDSKNEPHYP